MANKNFGQFTLEASPTTSQFVVGYNTSVSGGERRFALSDVLGLFRTQVFSTANGILQADGSGNVTSTGLTYSGTTLSVPAAFMISGAGVITIMPATSTGVVGIRQGDNVGLLLGADAGAQTVTNSTNKAGRFATPHYTNSQPPMGMMYGLSTSTANTVSIGGGTSSVNAATAIDFYTAANNTTITGTRRGGFNSSGVLDLTGTFSVGNTTDSSNTSTGAITTTGGVGIAKSLSVGSIIRQSATTTLAAGTTFAVDLGYNGTGDAGGASTLIAFNAAPIISGANNAAQNRGLYLNPRNNLDAGKTLTDEYGLIIEVFNINAGVTTNGYGMYARPRASSTGGYTTFTYSKFDSGVWSSTGDITGAITGQDVADIGRSAATTVTAFNVANQTKGSGNAYAYRGQMASASGKYNLYLDGSAQNYIAGITGIGVAPSATTFLVCAASTTGVSSFRLPHGSAPSSPVDGDIWTTTAGLFVRINGSTVGPLT